MVEFAVFEDEYAVHTTGNGRVVRHDDETCLQLCVEFEHQLEHMFAVPGIEISDPSCVDKTFPDYFDVLRTL